MTDSVRLVIVGAGARGSNYARLAVAGGRASIVAVAEPDPRHRAAFLAEHDLDPANVFSSWEELAAVPRLGDAVVIATHDRLHADPAVAFAELGYDLLLEKPMAPTEAETVRIVEAAEENGVLLAVCHVLRYSTYTRILKEIISSGEIGDIASVEHLEPVGWWHFAHSYVRGSWAREAESSSMLMAKSSHDIDWLSHIVGRPVTRVSSFGSLLHFRPENKPAEATDRCWTCPLQNSCAYAATRIYPNFLGDPVHERWPLGVLTTDVTPAGIDEALRTGPYGECVYNGQNDVADHQVVNLEYAGGITASFTVTAFTELDFRKTRLFGTRGSIEGDGRTLVIHDFVTDTTRTVVTDTTGGASAADGHGGADGEMLDTFLRAVIARDPRILLSGPRESLASHQVVWAAERARASGTVVTMPA